MDQAKKKKPRFHNKEEHEHCVFFTIYNGKSIKINLKGKTLSLSQGKLIVNKSRIELPVVPLGLTQPITIPMFVQNIGGSTLRYLLDYSRYQKMNPKISQKCELFFDTTEESINPGEIKNLNIHFLPISLKKFKINLPIIVKDYYKELKPVIVTLAGRATRTIHEKLFKKFFKIDDVIQLNKENNNEAISNVYMSEELIDFRNIELNSIQKRTMFLYNNSPSNAYEFNFSDFRLGE